MIFEALVYLLLMLAIVLAPFVWAVEHVVIPGMGWLLAAGVLGTVFVYLPLRAGLRLLRLLLPVRSAVDAGEVVAIGAIALPVVLYSMCWFWALPWPATYHGAFFAAMRFVAACAARVPVVWPLTLTERIPIPYVPRNFAVGVEVWALLFAAAAALDLVALAARAALLRDASGGGRLAAAAALKIPPVRVGLGLARSIFPPKTTARIVRLVLVGLPYLPVALYGLFWPWVIPWPAADHGAFFSVTRTAFRYVSRCPVVWPLSLVEKAPVPYLPRDFAVAVEVWALWYAIALAYGLIAVLAHLAGGAAGGRPASGSALGGGGEPEGPAESGPEAEMA